MGGADLSPTGPQPQPRRLSLPLSPPLKTCGLSRGHIYIYIYIWHQCTDAECADYVTEKTAQEVDVRRRKICRKPRRELVAFSVVNGQDNSPTTRSTLSELARPDAGSTKAATAPSFLMWHSRRSNLRACSCQPWLIFPAMGSRCMFICRGSSTEELKCRPGSNV